MNKFYDSPEGAVCLPDRIPVSDERNPVNGGIRPYRIADHIDGQDFIVVAVRKCMSLVIQYEVDPVRFHCSVEFFMTSDHDMLYFGRTREIR